MSNPDDPDTVAGVQPWVADALGNIDAIRNIHKLMLDHGPRGLADGRYKTTREPLLDLGWVFEPLHRPEWVNEGTPGYCFGNALDIAAGEASTYAYVEGFGQALVPDIHHAWAATVDTGRCIDVTWPLVESDHTAYLGIPFDVTYARTEMIRARNQCALLDNFTNSFELHRNGVPEHAIHPAFRVRAPKAHAWPIEVFEAQHRTDT